ncbi:MAG: MarC family protein [bacterium]|nr:MarC family protein [bacterium]
MRLGEFIEMAAYLVALVNPASKIFLLSTMKPAYTWRTLRPVAIKSTVAAFVILCVLTVIGNVVLDKVFNVELFSLNVAGGVILFLVGLNAVQHGRFYDARLYHRTRDISIVPLAAPLIAGPGTITATLSYAAHRGVLMTIAALSCALLVNLVCMLAAVGIGRALNRVNATGPLVRITGLIVCAVAVQMIFNGMGEWLSHVLVAR